MKIGDKIRTVRTMKGLSQENLAEMIGISRLAYGDIERNKSSISEERLSQILNALGVSIEDLQNVGETIANFFDQCNNNASVGIINGDQNNNYDARETQHKLEIALLQIDKMAVELEKAKIEVELWKSKNNN